MQRGKLELDGNRESLSSIGELPPNKSLIPTTNAIHWLGCLILPYSVEHGWSNHGVLWTKCNMQQRFLWICDILPTTPQNQNQVSHKELSLTVVSLSFLLRWNWSKYCRLPVQDHEDHSLLEENRIDIIVAVQLPSHDQLFVTPWTAAHQAFLPFTISWSLLKLMSIESVMLSHHLILCCLLLGAVNTRWYITFTSTSRAEGMPISGRHFSRKHNNLLSLHIFQSSKSILIFLSIHHSFYSLCSCYYIPCLMLDSGEAKFMECGLLWQK